MTFSAADFMSGVPRSTSGSDSWAEHYGNELRSTVIRYANNAPRSVQKALGPSELGHVCDRLVVGKMAGSKRTNNVSDPWASIVGTALHAYLANVFDWDNAANNYWRWVTETRVTPDPGDDPHPGTADLYDAYQRALVDHKCQSESVRAKLRSQGPPIHYFVQLLLYRRGYMQLGLPVERVVIASWPRTKSSLDDLYIWSHIPTNEDEVLLDKVLAQTRIRQRLADEIKAGRMSIMDIPPTPDDSECFFCPLYRPQAAYDGQYGCPGTLLLKS